MSKTVLQEQARKAYQNGDVQLSKKIHQEQDQIKQANGDDLKHQQEHKVSGEFIKSAVYGGLDGIITAFAIVMGVLGAGFSNMVVLALGVSNIISNGVGMGLGDYLASRSQSDFIQSEQKREAWEVETNPEGEKKEMYELYTKKGMDAADAKQVVDILQRNQKAWVEIMMIQELELLPGDDNPAMNGVVTTLSFFFFGFIPLLPYIVAESIGDHTNDEHLPMISIIMAGVFLFILGTIKSFFTDVSLLVSGFETLLIGGVAAAAAYYLGKGIERGINGE